MANAAVKNGSLKKYVVAEHPTKYVGPAERLSTRRWLKYVQAAGYKLLPNSDISGYVTNRVFDVLSTRDELSCDLFIGYSGSCLSTLRTAKENGAKTVVYRSAPHGSFFSDTIDAELRQDGFSGVRRATPRMTPREQKEYHEADLIWTPSRFVLDTLEREGVKKPSKLLPFGVDTDLFYPSDDDLSGFKILYVGSITPEKGVHTLLDGFERADIPGAELVLIGKKDERIAINKESLKNVNFLGWMNRDKLREHYQDASVFVMPSLGDGFGAVIIEALACGCPVITTERVGAGEYVREHDSGRIIPPRAPDILAGTLEEAYENESLRQRWRGNALDMIGSGFASETRQEQMAQLYEEIINSELPN